MALAERAELVAELRLDDKFSGPIGKATRSLDKLDSRAAKVGRGFNTLGRGIGTAMRNATTVAIGAAAALGGLLALSVKEGQDALKTQQVYAKAIENSANMTKAMKEEMASVREEMRMAKPGSSEYNKLADSIDMIRIRMKFLGPVTAAQTKLLNEQQEALMDLAGVDDELIKAEQTRLIQMGLSGRAALELTPLILDMSKATGRDLLQSATAVGKALNGNTGALGRYGVVIDKVRAKTDPYGAVLDALKSKFEGVTASMSGNFDTRLAVLRERMANIREEVGIKLLPALTRIVDVVGKSLVPAFGKFIDRILPTVSKGLDDFARALENGGAERAINGIGDALGSVLEVMKLLAAPAKAIVGAFMALPKELQTVIIGGLAVNKLSGGLIGKGLGQIIGGALGSRGGSPANPVFVEDVTGSGPGGGVLGAGKTGGLARSVAGLLKTTVALAVAAVAVEKLGEQWNVFQSDARRQESQFNATWQQGIPQLGLDAAEAALRNIDQQLGNPINDLALQLSGTRDDVYAAKQALLDHIAALKAGKEPGRAQIGPPVPTYAKRLGPVAPPKNAADVLKTPRFAGIVERAKDKGLDAPTIARVVAISEKTKANRAKLTAIVGDDKQKWEVGWRILKAGGEVTAERINAVIEKTNAAQRAAVREAAEKQAAESRRADAAMAIRDSAMRILQSITNARLATIAAKDFSPKITVPVYVSSYVSVRDMAVRQQTRATYTRVGIE